MWNEECIADFVQLFNLSFDFQIRVVVGNKSLNSWAHKEMNMNQVCFWTCTLMHVHAHICTHIHTHTHMHTHTDTHTHKADRWVTSINKLLSFCLCGWPVHTESCSYTHWACSWGGKKSIQLTPPPPKTHTTTMQNKNSSKNPVVYPWVQLINCDHTSPQLNAKLLRTREVFRGQGLQLLAKSQLLPQHQGDQHTDCPGHPPTAWTLTTSDTCLQPGHWLLQTPAYRLDTDHFRHLPTASPRPEWLFFQAVHLALNYKTIFGWQMTSDCRWNFTL